VGAAPPRKKTVGGALLGWQSSRGGRELVELGKDRGSLGKMEEEEEEEGRALRSEMKREEGKRVYGELQAMGLVGWAADLMDGRCKWMAGQVKPTCLHKRTREGDKRKRTKRMVGFKSN
jgi:hypothetical protein